MGLPGIYVVVPVILVWFITMGNAAEEQEKLRAQSPGMFQVQVKQGYLSLAANQAPLVAIFHEIGEQATITFDSNIGPEEKITIALVRVPLEQVPQPGALLEFEIGPHHRHAHARLAGLPMLVQILHHLPLLRSPEMEHPIAYRDRAVVRARAYGTRVRRCLGVERVCARKHHVTDIREFYKNDVRFLRQF